MGKAKQSLGHKARLYLLDNDAVALLGPRQLVSLAEERVKGLVDAVREMQGQVWRIKEWKPAKFLP